MDRGVVFKIVARYLEAFSVKESLVRRGGCACVRVEGREGCACVMSGGERRLCMYDG